MLLSSFCSGAGGLILLIGLALVVDLVEGLKSKATYKKFLGGDPMYKTLITASELVHELSAPNWAIVDCRFSLNDSERGRKDYLQAHIPGAVYAHLNEDLSGEIIPGVTSRHPLPPIEK